MRAKPEPLTQRDVEGLAGIYYRAITREHEDNPGDADGWGYGIDIASDLLGHVSGRERVHGREADHLLQDAGLTKDSDSRDRLCEAMNRAYLDAMRSLTKRAKGDYSPYMVIGRLPEAPGPRRRLPRTHRG